MNKLFSKFSMKALARLNYENSNFDKNKNIFYKEETIIDEKKLPYKKTKNRKLK